jgi:hypothetical protein
MTGERQVGELPPGLGLPEPEHPAWQMVNVFPDSTLGQQAWLAHQRELPRLLETARGQWVAYHGDGCLGVGPSPLRLYEACVARGFSPEELVICQIEPIAGQESVGMGVCWVDEGGSTRTS